MEVFMNYFVPVLCLIMISTIPVYTIRIYMFTVRTHFIKKELSRKISFITNMVSFFLFLILLVIFTKDLGGLAYYVYAMLAIIMVGVLLGYRSVSLHQKMNMYLVTFSKNGNKEIWQKELEEKHIFNQVVDGSFSFVSEIKHNSTSQKEIDEIHKEYSEREDLFIEFQSLKAHLIFAFNVLMLSISMVCFILFFILIQAL